MNKYRTILGKAKHVGLITGLTAFTLTLTLLLGFVGTALAAIVSVTVLHKE